MKRDARRAFRERDVTEVNSLPICDQKRQSNDSNLNTLIAHQLMRETTISSGKQMNLAVYQQLP
jgi:hypothetical protein